VHLFWMRARFRYERSMPINDRITIRITARNGGVV